MTKSDQSERCRLVLIAPPEVAGSDEGALLAALGAGDVASLILPQYDLDETAFQRRAESIVAPAQERGVAVMIAGEPRLAHRLKADGIHFEGSKSALAEMIGKNSEQMMIGCGGAKTRDDALELGETQPDYIFFGRFGYDTKPEPHSRNLSLGRWWAEMIRVPCIVMAGCDLSSVETVAACNAEFVALSSAVFGNGIDPAEAVSRANAILDARASGLRE